MKKKLKNRMSYADIRFFYLSLQLINNINLCGRIAYQTTTDQELES